MSDKIEELAEKLALQTGGDGFSMNCYRFKRILRTELKPLLDACESEVGHQNGLSVERLATELQNWTARNPDGR